MKGLVSCTVGQHPRCEGLVSCAVRQHPMGQWEHAMCRAYFGQHRGSFAPTEGNFPRRSLGRGDPVQGGTRQVMLYVQAFYGRVI